METALICVVLACLLVRVQNDQGKRRLTRPDNIFALTAGGVVLLALFVAIDPEARIFLMFLDSVGVDFFVTVCVLYLRHNLVLAAAILLIPILKWTYRWGAVPGFWPSRLVLSSSATWAGYAVMVPVMALCSATFAALCAIAVLSEVARLLGLA